MKRGMLWVILSVAALCTACSLNPRTGQHFRTTDSIGLGIITNSDMNSQVNRAEWRAAIFNASGGITGWQVLAVQSNETNWLTGGDNKQYYYYGASAQLQSSSWTNAVTGYAEGCSGSWCPKHALIKAQLVGNNGYTQNTYTYDEDALGCMNENFFSSEGGYAVMGNCSNDASGIIVIYATN